MVLGKQKRGAISAVRLAHARMAAAFATGQVLKSLIHRSPEIATETERSIVANPYKHLT